MGKPEPRIEIESTYFHRYETIAIAFEVHTETKLTNEQKLMLINVIHSRAVLGLKDFIKEVLDGS